MATISVKDGSGNFVTVPVLPLGQTSAAGSVSVVPASDVGGISSVTVSPAITSIIPYVTGNQVGGLMTFSSAVNSITYSGVIDSIVIKSKSIQTSGFNLYLFKTNPASSTWTDKTTPAINASDIPYLIGVYSFDATDDSGLGTITLYQSSSTLGNGNSPKAIVLTSSNLYGVLVATGTPTFNSTSDISVTVNILKS
jgi:hypothetical protein